MSQAPKAKSPSLKAPTKYALGLLMRDGGYSVVKYELSGDRIISMSQTEPDILISAFAKVDSQMRLLYTQINAGGQ